MHLYGGVAIWQLNGNSKILRLWKSYHRGPLIGMRMS
jgi:hypothetical protein